MDHYNFYDGDDGLGGSLLIYAVAIVGGLMLFILPVFLMNGPTAYQNAGVENFDQILPSRAGRNHFPLARLEQPAVVDPATIAALNAEAQKERAAHAAASPSRAVAEPPAARRTYAEASSRPRNPFALFFSLF